MRWLFSVALVAWGSAVFAQADKPISFINDVAPILKENCYACHDAKKKSGKYDMTTFEKMMAGGAAGEGITAGKHADSEVFTLMVTDKERRMPPRKDNLSPVAKAQTEIVKKWIDQGAKLDAGIDPKSDLVKELRKRWKAPNAPETYKFPAVVNALAFSPDGKSLVVGGHHELTVWDFENGKLLKRIATRSERAYAMLFLADGKLAVAGGRPGQEGDVRLYDITVSGKDTAGVQRLDGIADPKVMLKQLLEVDDSVLCLALSTDGKYLASGGCDRTIRVWEIASGKQEQTIENHADWVMGISFSRDDKFLFSAGRDKTAKVWSLATKESVLTFPDHQNVVYGVACKTDGKAGISAGADRQVRTWNSSGEAKQIKVLGSHNDEILKLVAHGSKPLFLTASADKTVKLWDLDAGTNTKTMSGLTDHVFATCFNKDATLVAAGGYDGVVAVWKIDGTLVKSFSASPGIVLPTPPVDPKKK